MAERHLERVLDVVQSMERVYGVSTASATAQLTALLRLQRYDELEALWRRLRALGVERSTSMYNMMIQATRNRGHNRQALALFEEMRREHKQPDRHSISLLISV